VHGIGPVGLVPVGEERGRGLYGRVKGVLGEAGQRNGAEGVAREDERHGAGRAVVGGPRIVEKVRDESPILPGEGFGDCVEGGTVRGRVDPNELLAGCHERRLPRAKGGLDTVGKRRIPEPVPHVGEGP
jgi:hypothetical protein